MVQLIGFRLDEWFAVSCGQRLIDPMSLPRPGIIQESALDNIDALPGVDTRAKVVDNDRRLVQIDAAKRDESVVNNVAHIHPHTRYTVGAC